jgi:hypothetical protein
MSDTDTLTLKEAGNAVMEIDVRYRTLNNIDDKEDLKPARDKAFDAYSRARLALLEEGVLTDQAALDEMVALRKEVEDAADVQTLIAAAGRIALFLAKFAV